MTAGRSAADASVVEQQPVAEVLPGLYRAVLDAVADLELRGLRPDAAKLRLEATRAYSGAWNPAAVSTPTTSGSRVLEIFMANTPLGYEVRRHGTCAYRGRQR